MKDFRIRTGLILMAMIALFCCGIAGAEGAGDLPRVTVTTWGQMKTALDTHPDGVFITLGRTIVAGQNDTAFQIKGSQNVIVDLNGKTLNRNTIYTSSDSENRTFNV